MRHPADGSNLARMAQSVGLGRRRRCAVFGVAQSQIRFFRHGDDGLVRHDRSTAAIFARLCSAPRPDDALLRNTSLFVFLIASVAGLISLQLSH